MHKFKTVFAFEYSNFIKSKSYLVVTILFTLLVVAAGSIPSILKLVDTVKESFAGDNASGADSASPDDLKTAYLIDPQGVYDDATLAAFLPPHVWTRVDSTSGAESAIENGDAELALFIDGLTYRLYMKGENLMSGGLPGVDGMVLTMYKTTALLSHGLTPAEIAAIEGAAPVSEIIPVGKDISQTFWLSYFILFLLYMTTLMYGQFVLTSVVTEKSSKAMELLVTSAKPMALMFGKVMGTGLAGLTQFGLMMLGAGLAIRLNLDGWLALSPMVGAIMNLSLSGGLFAYAVIFFLLGFFTYAFVFAGVGSTVSRMEEASAVSGVPIMLFIAAFAVSMGGMAAPTELWVRVCSYVPFLSSMVMFMRICVTDMPFWEILLGIIVNILYMLAAGYAAARIYRVGVLMYGKQPKLKEIVKYIFK